MGLTIGVRFIEGGKSKRAVIISKIRGRNAYPSGMTKFRTNRRLRRGWCHRIQDRRVICRRHEGDEKWDHSSETPFEIHHNQGNNRDEYKAGALFVHEEEERQSKHN